MRRREFIALGGVVVAWPLAARAQQGVPTVGFLLPAGLPAESVRLAAFRKGLGETGYVEGHNVVVERRALAGPARRARKAR